MSPKLREAFIRIQEALFQPQQVIRSPRAQDELPSFDYLLAVGRHMRGEWGDVSAEQARQNEVNVQQGAGHLLSVFTSSTGEVFWVATDASWRWTGVMFPEEHTEWEAFHQERDLVLH
jgi:hypothetical protein